MHVAGPPHSGLDGGWPKSDSATWAGLRVGGNLFQSCNKRPASNRDAEEQGRLRWWLVGSQLRSEYRPVYLPNSVRLVAVLQGLYRSSPHGACAGRLF